MKKIVLSFAFIAFALSYPSQGTKDLETSLLEGVDATYNFLDKSVKENRAKNLNKNSVCHAFWLGGLRGHKDLVGLFINSSELNRKLTNHTVYMTFRTAIFKKHHEIVSRLYQSTEIVKYLSEEDLKDIKNYEREDQ